MSKATIISFKDQFVALVKGDDATVQAEKTLRQAQSSIKSHISVFEGETNDLEDSIETAKANLDRARVNNGNLISGKDERASYVARLVRAKNYVSTSEINLEDHLDKIKFLKDELESIS